MPKGKGKGKKKGKKKGKEKGKEKGKKNDKNQVGPESPENKLLKVYQQNCAISNSQVAPNIRKSLKQAIEDEKVVSKFILESAQVEEEGGMQILFEPFITSIRQVRYMFIRDLHVWDYPISYIDMCCFTLLLEKPFYQLRLIEFMDCLLEPLSLRQLATVLPRCVQLTHLQLDYNEFGDEGVKNLCQGLKDNFSLLSVSLCYCDLGVASGKYLGQIVSTTALRELYLDGNNLECEGTMELIKLCVDQAEYEAFQRAEEERRKADEKALKEEEEREIQNSTDHGQDSTWEKASDTPGSAKKKKKKKGKRKKKGPPGPPPAGPWIHKLHLADNGIDGLGDAGSLAPIICMRLLKKLLMNSKCFEELDLDDNLIGEVGGLEILEGLTQRKEQKMGGVKVRTTHRLTADTFNSIVKLGSGLKKKKGRKKGKKKKK